MSRWKAAAIHLAISVLIALVAISLMRIVWYPGSLFTAMGGEFLLVLLVGIDVALGPLITLIIFDVKKKSLRFDLTVIGIIQFGALVYGSTIMSQARPAYIVYYKDQFDIVIPARIPASELARAKGSVYESIPFTGPRFVALKELNDKKEIERMSFKSEAASDFVAFPQHYVPYGQRAAVAGSYAKSLAELKKKNPQIEAELKSVLASTNTEELKAGYLPLNTKDNDMAVILEKSTGKILGMIFANPW
jgi:hypothetical protein